MRLPGSAVGVLWVLVAACSMSGEGDDRRPAATPGAPLPVTSSPAKAPAEPDAAVEIRLRVERRVTDAATEGFEALVRDTLTDDRGWQGAGFRFILAPDAPFTVVLAEGEEVDALCAPYDTGGRYSCQNGATVALNAERWRHATLEWTGDLHDYRRMLVNHEVGHHIGQHHPVRQCPAPGEPAPVMAQQSTNLDGCDPNPWPLPWEIACARQHVEPIAPGYEPDPTPSCGPTRRSDARERNHTFPRRRDPAAVGPGMRRLDPR